MTQYTRRSPEQWQALVQQWQENGLSAPRFCEQHEIGYASFCNWRKRFNTQDSPAEESSSEVSGSIRPLQMNGYPVLTLSGESFLSRIGHSIISNAGLEGFIQVIMCTKGCNWLVIFKS